MPADSFDGHIVSSLTSRHGIPENTEKLTSICLRFCPVMAFSVTACVRWGSHRRQIASGVRVFRRLPSTQCLSAPDLRKSDNSCLVKPTLTRLRPKHCSFIFFKVKKNGVGSLKLRNRSPPHCSRTVTKNERVWQFPAHYCSVATFGGYLS